MSLLIPKMKELTDDKLHTALCQLKHNMGQVEATEYAIHGNIRAMKEMVIDYQDANCKEPLDVFVLEGLLTSVEMHTQYISSLLGDLERNFNIHDV